MSPICPQQRFERFKTSIAVLWFLLMSIHVQDIMDCPCPILSHLVPPVGWTTACRSRPLKRSSRGRSAPPSWALLSKQMGTFNHHNFTMGALDIRSRNWDDFPIRYWTIMNLCGGENNLYQLIYMWFICWGTIIRCLRIKKREGESSATSLLDQALWFAVGVDQGWWRTETCARYGPINDVFFKYGKPLPFTPSMHNIVTAFLGWKCSNSTTM